MRLGDMKSDDEPVPAEVEAELDALDAALRGEEVPAGMEGLEALVSDLRAEEPEPEPRFEAELDAWAAAGFPRGAAPGRQGVRRRVGRRRVRLLLALWRRRLARLGAHRGDRGDAGRRRRVDHAGGRLRWRRERRRGHAERFGRRNQRRGCHGTTLEDSEGLTPAAAAAAPTEELGA